MLCHGNYIRSLRLMSINLWVWGMLRLCMNINIILYHWSYFRRSYRHMLIFLMKLRNFRNNFKFIDMRRCRHWFDSLKIWLYLYLLLLRIRLNFVLNCLKECIISFKWRALIFLQIFNNSLNLVIVFLSKISLSDIPGRQEPWTYPFLTNALYLA